MPVFLYKERQKRKAATRIHGLFKTPDYSKISPTPELREKIRQGVNKSPR